MEPIRRVLWWLRWGASWCLPLRPWQQTLYEAVGLALILGAVWIQLTGEDPARAQVEQANMQRLLKLTEASRDDIASLHLLTENASLLAEARRLKGLPAPDSLKFPIRIELNAMTETLATIRERIVTQVESTRVLYSRLDSSLSTYIRLEEASAGNRWRKRIPLLIIGSGWLVVAKLFRMLAEFKSDWKFLLKRVNNRPSG